MKKIKFISAIALTLALGACDNFDLPNPPGQTYPAPDGYFEDADLTLTPNPEALSMTAFNEANQYVPVATVNEIKNFPEGYELVVDMKLGSGEKSTIVNTTIDGDKLTVNPDILNGAVQSVLTKEPGTYDVPVSFLAYAVRGTTRMGLGGEGATYGDGQLKIKTYDAAKVIEDAYYVVPVLNGQPAFAQAVLMNNTGGTEVSPYDNPEFAVKLDVPEDTYFYFVIAPASAKAASDKAGVYGGNPAADGMSGKLGESYGVIKMPVAGSVLVTVNMELDSYTINYAFDVLYALSGSTKAENAMWLYTDNYINYYGVTAINQRFMIYTQPDKKGVAFKLDDAVEQVVSEDGLEVTGGITAETSATSQITVPVKRNCLYYLDVNLVQKTYDAKALQTLAIIGDGDAINWNHEKSVELTPSRDLKIWTATDVELNSEFKIAANKAWEFDFGGTQVQTSNGSLVYNLQFKGGNMPCEKGTYDVKIDFSTKPYVLTLTKK